MNKLLTVYVLNKKQNTSLFILSIFSIILLLLRVKITHSIYLLFMLWNLFLALIPYSISSYIKPNFSIKKSNLINLIYLITWGLFIHHCHGDSFRSKNGNMSHSTADRRRSDRSSFEKISYDIHLSRLRAAKGTIDSKPPRPHPLTNRADMDQVRFRLILFQNARYGSHHSTGSQTSSTINSPLFSATKTCCH